MPLYFCEGSAWVDEQTYKTIYFYIQQAYVEDNGAGSISTIAHIAKSGGTRVYRFNSNGEIIPDNELGLIPEGTKVQILNSLSEEGHSTGWNQYLTQSTVWVSCEIFLEDNSYDGCLIPLKDLSYDARLMLPTMWTEG